MSRAATGLFLAILVLALTACTMLALGARPSDLEVKRAREFQELVGGLGFGPALDLSRCASQFDPRLCPACSQDMGPIPASKVHCLHHAAAVIDYPESRDRR